ncbi:hypothetical protein PG994_000979 [Apiospora phragmitis]|uniref:Uncharacterized protein n=1 Tax=Apiospora phragmitis TaxID=2905665 RepID=A0ABR1WR58_9PEZI
MNQKTAINHKFNLLRNRSPNPRPLSPFTQSTKARFDPTRSPLVSSWFPHLCSQKTASNSSSTNEFKPDDKTHSPGNPAFTYGEYHTRPWIRVRFPDTYKGLGAVTASVDGHAHVFPIEHVIDVPPIQWTKAQCNINQDEFTKGRLRKESDYVIVRSTPRVKKTMERAQEAAKREKGSVKQYLKAKITAPLIEVRELWEDFRMAMEARRARRGVNRRIAVDARLDHQNILIRS